MSRRLPAIPSPACELLREYLREIYSAADAVAHSREFAGREESHAAHAGTPFESPRLVADVQDWFTEASNGD